jgi:hypothetical protein
MKLSTAKVIGDILLAIKINRIPDKDAKAILINDYLAIHKAVKCADDDREALASKFREDWADEIAKQDNSVEYIKAKSEASEAIIALYEQEADIALGSVPSEFLYNPDLWGESDTLGQIANSVELLVKNGIAVE